jgi:hypothetical protein
MMRALCLLLTSALVSFTAIVPVGAEVVRQDDGPLGNYSVGAWTGRCVRDGWLGFAKNESCGAYLDAFVNVRLNRTVKGLIVTVGNAGCCKDIATAKMSVRALAAPNRVEALELLIQKLLNKMQKKCGLEGENNPVKREDLADILTETDGLEF